MDAEKRKKQVVELLKSLETGEPGPMAVINPDKYIQHNLGAADGLKGLKELLALLPPGSTKVQTIRVFADGDYVFAHTAYDFFGPKIGFDVFRFEDGLIVEHWDNLQETPVAPNPSGHLMIDGPTAAADLDKTRRNKELVAAFLEDVLVGGRVEKLADYLSAESYVQHNPAVADGLSGLAALVSSLAKQGITLRYDRVHRVLGEGDFVLAMSEGTFGQTHMSFYDLFRVKGEKLVEHWDVLEPIPPVEEHRNLNGKF